MGILGLAKLIGDIAPQAIKENEFKNYFGRKVAVDASMSLYQFLIAVRQEGAQLTSADGETTSHLMGFFYRTIRMVENGIKPVYVFDGKPPQMKSGELEKRTERRNEAQKALDIAVEAGNVEEIDKQSRRLVKVSKTHVEEAQKLLKLMGIPFVTAPCEAEAQCAALQKSGKVYAVATEDMDALTFGTKVLLRHLTFSEARKMPIKEFYLEKVLEALEFTMDEFIDMCILLGCDYCDSIKGIGPKRALDLIRQHRSIETIVEKIDSKKYGVPENWPFKEARRLFKEPEITESDQVELNWTGPDEEGLVKFLVEEKGFAEDRIRNGSKKLQKAKQTSTQVRLDTFFTVKSTTQAKRPAETKKEEKGGKKGRGGGSGYRRGK
ncbi:flap endonuclease 1 [Folsomia candida]|uniref:Flap endonuclease 1 n=1 Tax=Folsomia candida TaxID=158441 RepID=A0A226F121_FOLCA|nr:flap endonuclease 1 [Folsomia candida]OXA63127.1 Flap endonuclease 1 [Folsomia candida]